MPKLNDTQTLLLSAASQREGGSVLPLPDGRTTGPRVAKALAALRTAGMLIERETSDVAEEHRTDGDLSYGLYLTAAGLEAIGVEPASEEAAGETFAPAPALPRVTKSAAVLALLGRENGATLAELIEATGWLPHTTRAALTGLRKKGHALVRGRRGNATCYSLAAAGEA